MRDDLLCFEFFGRRVCVKLDTHNSRGWSYTIDGTEEPEALKPITPDERAKLEEAGMIARDRIRMLQTSPARSLPRQIGVRMH